MLAMMQSAIHEGITIFHALVRKVAFCVFIFSFYLFPALAHAEYIDSLTADINIHVDSSFTDTEYIAYVFSSAQHGIYRCIPTMHQDKASSLFKERYVTIAVQSVQMDTAPVPYTLDTQKDKICVRIGDPTKTVTGTHQYIIAYTVDGAVSYEQFGGANV